MVIFIGITRRVFKLFTHFLFPTLHLFVDVIFSRDFPLKPFGLLNLFKIDSLKVVVIEELPYELLKVFSQVLVKASDSLVCLVEGFPVTFFIISYNVLVQ